MAILKFRRDGAEVESSGLNEAAETIVEGGITTKGARSKDDGEPLTMGSSTNCPSPHHLTVISAGDASMSYK